MEEVAFNFCADTTRMKSTTAIADAIIADVTMLVDYLMEQAGNDFILANADVNKDGNIDISDVVELVNIILNGE